MNITAHQQYILDNMRKLIQLTQNAEGLVNLLATQKVLDKEEVKQIVWKKNNWAYSFLFTFEIWLWWSHD